jgi:hypothetical protein
VVDLTKILSYTSAAVDTYYEVNQRPRTHLGLSEVGHPCKRYLWYRHHGYPTPPIPGRTLRLFELGKIIEDAVINDLQLAGFTVHSRQKEISFEDGDIKLTGHLDGIIEGLVESSKPHLLEIKSANGKSFGLIKGSYEKWQPKYKGQIHVGMLGAKLKRCLVAVYNKDNSDLYTERIPLDRDYAIRILVDVFNAIQKPTEPERACPRPDWFEARWCPFYEECFKP